MTLEKKDWEESLKAWKSIKQRAEIDLEQANFFIKSLEEFIQCTYTSLPEDVNTK